MWLWLCGCIILAFFYFILQYTYKKNWEAIPVTAEPTYMPFTQVSIIIPARNEEDNIINLLQSIQSNDYPKEYFEVIVIDDHSEDGTFSVVQGLAYDNVAIYHLKDLLPADTYTEAYKKRAIEAAIHIARGELIVTTDADCIVGEKWLKTIAHIYEKEKCAAIVAPVLFVPQDNLFEQFQALDFSGMIAITFASIKMKMYNMANGANLAFSKAAFIDVGGYAGIDHKASGDDMLLIYKIAKTYDGKVSMAKSEEALVYTRPVRDLNGFLQQRFRWTSKAADYQDRRITVILSLVYLFVLSIAVNLVLGCVMIHELLYLFLLQCIVKYISDYLLLSSVTNFFDKSIWMKNFFMKELLHSLYIVFVGTLGNIMPYKWKGRKLH